MTRMLAAALLAAVAFTAAPAHAADICFDYASYPIVCIPHRAPAR